MGAIATCTPQQQIADELDCLGVPYEEYEDGVDLVFSNGQEVRFDNMPEGGCTCSPCRGDYPDCGIDVT